MRETENTVTDAEALKALESTQKSPLRIANTFVPRTILYAVAIEYKPGIKTTEIRTFVRQGEFCSASQWEKALELEKEFAGINKKYHDGLKAAGKQVTIKGSSNPLKATPLSVQ